ncbi:MAG: hypothetical protein FD174_4106 [Geobacteraceae bacterium]|nr:MAG: hypothetical protein FD174_4106 [Geobacteraceae bacterium]
MEMMRCLSFRRLMRFLVLTGAALALAACAARMVTVAVPPRVELTSYPSIGVIEFVSTQPGTLGTDATREFIANLHGAQPGVRILELSSQAKVLQEVGHSELDFRAIRAIGEKYRVAAVLTGTIELSEPRPDVNISTSLSSISAKAKVDGRMSAKLWETDSGASTWSNSSWGNWTVGGISLSSDGDVRAGYHYPKEKQDQILMSLIKALNGDFWPTYEKRKIEEGE